jgi:hypothetical protein
MIHAYMALQLEEAMSCPSPEIMLAVDVQLHIHRQHKEARSAAGVEESNKDRNLKGRKTFI